MILHTKAYLSHDACIADRVQDEFTSVINIRTLQHAMYDNDEDGYITEGSASIQTQRTNYVII